MSHHIERTNKLPEEEQIPRLKSLVNYARRAQIAANKRGRKRRAQYYANQEYQFRVELESRGVQFVEVHVDE